MDLINMNQQGTLIIRPICANLKRDTDFFTKMDPYCVIKLGSQKQRTKVANSAGKNPNWNDQLVFKRSFEDIIHIEVWDYDSGSSDDLVAEGNISVQNVLSRPNWEEAVQLSYKGRSAGEVRLSVTFYAEQAGQSGFGMPTYATHLIQQPAYPVYPPGMPPPNMYPPNMYPSNMHPPNMYPPNMYPPNMPPSNIYPQNMPPPNLYPPNMPPPNMYPPNTAYSQQYPQNGTFAYNNPYQTLNYPNQPFPPNNYPHQNMYPQFPPRY